MPAIRDRVLGIVSNCWKFQLDAGQSLEKLVTEAAERGYRAIELRQGCLGEFESVLSDDPSGAGVGQLSNLCRRFPNVRFNLAIALPCFNGRVRADDSSFLAALRVCQTITATGRPHLRLVDTETRLTANDTVDTRAVGQLLAEFTKRCIEAEGELSIEHAYQAWPVFQTAMAHARHLLESSDRLRICFDPCNLLLTEQIPDVPSIVDSVSPPDVSMIHLKQRRNGQIQSEVGAGDLDWPRLIAALDDRGHPGPWLFEVAPDADVWNNLERSISYAFGG